MAKPSPRPLTSLERAFLPPLLEIEATPPVPWSRALVWLLAAATTILIGWASVAEINNVATATGKVIPAGKLNAVQGRELAVVRMLHVKDGQHVTQGQLLVELDPTIAAADLRSTEGKIYNLELDQERLRGELGYRARPVPPELRTEERNLQHTLGAAWREVRDAQATAAQNEHAEKEMVLAASRAELNKLASSLAAASEREARVLPYIGQAISAFEYGKLQEAVMVGTSAVAAQEHRVEADVQAALAAHQKLLQIRAERRQQALLEMKEAAGAIRTLHAEAEKGTHVLGQKEIHASVSGLIQSIEVNTVGAVVAPGQTIMSIVPDHAPLLVEAWLDNEDVGQVAVGQRAEIKVATYPFERFGMLKGELIWISPDAQEHSSAQEAVIREPATSGTARYRVHIRPDPLPARASVASTSARLGVGMAVNADIEVGKRKVISFILAPLIKNLKESVNGK